MALLLTTMMASAQPQLFDPVSWSTSVEQIADGERVEHPVLDVIVLQCLFVLDDIDVFFSAFLTFDAESEHIFDSLPAAVEHTSVHRYPTALFCLEPLLVDFT